MYKAIKTFLTLFVLVGLLAACASQTTEEPEPTPTPTPEPVVDVPDEPVEPVDITQGISTVFYFDFDQYTLKSEGRAALTVHAEALRNNPQSVRLEGHADERGSREYNMALGERRANAVRDFLVLQGVDSSLIETVSYGEERPAAFGSNESSWEQNRRVELVK